MSDELYVWVSKWETFQHYAPERDRCPAWIKDYTKQLDDERYLDLSDRQRALVRDLRDIFAIAHGRVRRDAAKIGRRRNAPTRDEDLAALNHAGLIEFVSREDLEHRLEKFYSESRPRARPRSRGEVELEVEDPPTPAKRGNESLRDNGLNPRAKGTNPRAKNAAQRRDKSLRAFIRRVQGEYTTDAILEELVGTYHATEEEARALVDQEHASTKP